MNYKIISGDTQIEIQLNTLQEVATQRRVAETFGGQVVPLENACTVYLIDASGVPVKKVTIHEAFPIIKHVELAFGGMFALSYHHAKIIGTPPHGGIVPRELIDAAIHSLDAPVPQADVVLDATKVLQEQREKGVAKYGIGLEGCTKTGRELLRDTQEEIADASMYLAEAFRRLDAAGYSLSKELERWGLEARWNVEQTECTIVPGDDMTVDYTVIKKNCAPISGLTRETAMKAAAYGDEVFTRIMLKDVL